MKPYVPGTGLKALHSLFHLIVMITCKVHSHSHFKAKKTGTERVNNLPKTTHQVRLELELKAGQDHRAMLPPVNHHKAASCPCPLQLKVCFIFSPPGGMGWDSLHIVHSHSFCPNAEAISVWEFQTNEHASTSIGHCNSRCKKSKTPWRKPLYCE